MATIVTIEAGAPRSSGPGVVVVLDLAPDVVGCHRCEPVGEARVA